MKTTLITCLAIITFLSFGCAQKDNGIQVLTIEEFKSKMIENRSDLVLLDVRTPDEVAQGIIPGATHVDFYQKGFDVVIQKLNKDVPYFIYCGAGIRSNKTAAMMLEMGFNEVYDLKGGMSAWRKAGEPIN